MDELNVVAIDDVVMFCFWLSLVAVTNGLVMSPLIWSLYQEIDIFTIIPSKRKALLQGIVLIAILTLIINLVMLFRLADLINYQGWSF